MTFRNSGILSLFRGNCISVSCSSVQFSGLWLFESLSHFSNFGISIGTLLEFRYIFSGLCVSTECLRSVVGTKLQTIKSSLVYDKIFAVEKGRTSALHVARPLLSYWNSRGISSFFSHQHRYHRDFSRQHAKFRIVSLASISSIAMFARKRRLLRFASGHVTLHYAFRDGDGL